jgi:hypothetical protein
LFAIHQSLAGSAASGLLAVVLAFASPALGAEFRVGSYSFSDELGGFRLLSAFGSGTPDDPAVLVEEFPEAAPVTLVIRRFGELSGPSRDTFAPLTVIKVVTNRSNRVWAGFEVELQEILKQPSVYYDGLSFNQFGVKPPDVSSDSFAKNDRLFEPYDRIRFIDGHVDPEATARFTITITDPTPVAQFYLVQDPKLLSAGLPGGRSLALGLSSPGAGY